MKKFLSIIIFLLIISTFAFSTVEQKIYSTTNDIYKQISNIYLLSGHAMPSSTGPWSAAELLKMLENIDKKALPTALLDIYEEVEKTLNKDLDDIQSKGINLEFSGTLSIEGFAHTNTDDLFVGRENWSYDMVHQSPFLNLVIETSVAEHAYIYFAYPLQNCFHITPSSIQEIGCTNHGTNIICLQNLPYRMGFDTVGPDMNSPYRAFVAFGSENWNIQIGKDRLNWGLGKTGNMTISDNLPYHEMAKWTVFSDRFKFTFLVSSFPHKINFYEKTTDPDASDPNKLINKGKQTTDKKIYKGLNLYIAHRLEGRFFKDRLSISLTEAIMYASESGTINFKALNPATVFHNLYTACDTNSTLTLEFDFTPVKGLNFYAQVIIDELQLFGEDVASPKLAANPNCMGFLAGTKFSVLDKKGIISASLEAAYTSSYMYLRYSDNPYYGLDYIVALRTYTSSDDVVYDEYVLGYQYGPDVITTNINLLWEGFNKLSYSTNIFFMAHGTHDKWTKWEKIGGDNDYENWKDKTQTPTTIHESENYRDDKAKNRDSVSYTLDIGSYVSYDFSAKLRAFCQADYILIWNANNKSNTVVETDFQVVIGASWDF